MTKIRCLCRLIGAAMVWASFTWSAQASAASNAIDNVEYSQLADQVLVKVTFKQPLSAPPPSFTVSAPPRVAYDFADTENSFGKSAVTVNLGPLRSLNLAQGDTRTRLVLNLASTNKVDSRVEGNVLFLSLPSTPLANTTAPPSLLSTSVPGINRKNSESVSSINNLDFRAESMDVASIRIDLSEPNVVVDARQLPEGVQLYLPNSTAAGKLLKRLDVRDYGTPVETVTVANIGRGSQINFATRGDWDYNVRQLDTQLIVEFRRNVRDPNSLTDSKDLQGKMVSFNFTQPVPVSQMIGIFQDITGLNFVVMPGIAGEIQSLRMENTPVEEAITVISRMYNLGFRRYGKIVVVGRADDLVKYDREESERTEARLSIEPIQQETFRVKYRLAAEVVDALRSAVNTSQSASQSTGSSNASVQAGGGQAATSSSGTSTNLFLTKRGSLSVDPATNTIFVEETKSQLAKIRDRIQALDRPVKQVMIEARIVETSNTFFNALGVKIGSGSGFQYQIGGTKSNFTFSSSASSVNLPANTGTINFSLFNAAKTRIINLELDAAEGDSKIKQLANPKVMTRDTKNAKLKFGTKIAGYSQATAGQTPSVTYTDAVTLLDVKPQVQVDGKIQMDLTVKNDSPAGSTGNINNREITTSVIIENGGTIVIGGMYAQTDTNGTDRVPFLGDLPYVGWLFKQQLTKKEQSELLVFITPRIVSEELTLQ